jgi:hypothetical protein
MRKLIIAAVLLVLGLTACGVSGQNEELAGNWIAQYGYLLELNADGNGSRAIDGFGRENFTWTADSSRFHLSREHAGTDEIRNERWSFTLEADRLTITSRQDRSVIPRVYYRAPNQQDSALVGTWAFEYYADWTYTFNADGTGSRSVTPQENFYWSTYGGRLNINSTELYFGLEWEMWAFSINGDILTLDAMQAEETGGDWLFRYIRIR